MTLARNGRLALWLAVPAVAVVASLAAPARAAFHQFEAAVSYECPPDPREDLSDFSDALAVATRRVHVSSSAGPIDFDLFARGGFSSTTFLPRSTFPMDLRAATQFSAEPSPAGTTCTASSTATSRLRWGFQGPGSSTAYIPLELRMSWPIRFTTSSDTLLHVTEGSGVGTPQSAAFTFSADVVDADGVLISSLGDVNCDVNGCLSTSPVVLIDESSVDTSGQGYRERRWSVSTFTYDFDVLRSSTWAISLKLISSVVASADFAVSSTTYARLLDGLSYDLVSLDPSVSVVPLPEPAILSLLAAGAGAVAYLYRRRR